LVISSISLFDKIFILSFSLLVVERAKNMPFMAYRTALERFCS
jgi:hypothetical protein